MIEKLLKKIDENSYNVDKEIVFKAYNIAREAHKDQMRESGEPYIIHPIEVACILAELGMDTSTITAGILHDVIEDTDYSYDDIKEIFNEEIANLVEGVTKLGKIKYKSKEEQQADNVRKMLLAMARDIRVILIKLADRLHNMRTLKYMPIFKQKEKAKETLDIYAPLAHRLGISKIKWELEDLALRYINPNLYYELVKEIAQKRAEREAYISHIIEDLSQKLVSAGITSEIEGRPKHFYSIYNKMKSKNKNLDQIFDLTAVRILVNTVVDCYSTLGIVHTLYKPMPGRFKDYIAMPKPNMYQSLHSTVIGPKGKPFEIQIRTYDMHKTAEYGIAAHWKYKEGENGKEDDLESRLYWLRDILEWEGETSDPEEFMEAFKIDLFSDEVFVFTPKGKVINLPRNSTPLDFAYRIHTDIGNHCIGSKVNGKIVSLDYKLQTGEIVEVITSPSSKGPNIDWLSIANSNHAKSKIKSFFNKLKREENIEKGKELLEKEAKKQGCNFGDIAHGEKLDKIYKRYNLRTLEDLYSFSGAGLIAPSNIVSRLLEDRKKEEVLKETLENNIKNKKNTEKQDKDSMPELVLKDTNNLMARFAKCCNPVPGDAIIGYVTKGRGISVHRRDCRNVENLIREEKEKIIEITWENIKGSEFTCELTIKCRDRAGMLADAVQLLTQTKIHMCSINGTSRDDGSAVINLKVKIKSIETLKELIKKLRKLEGVLEVSRVNG